MTDFGVQLERIVGELVSGLLAAAREAALEKRQRELRTLQRAIAWQRELDAGLVASRADIARREGLSRSAVIQTMRFLEDLEAREDLASSDPPTSPAPAHGANHFTARAKSRRRQAGYRDLRRETLLRFDTDYISELLAEAGNNVSLAARMASIDRKHLWRLIQRTRVRSGRARRR